MPAVIELNAINFRYPKAKADVLQQVNLSVEEGRCFGLLGPNGAGKTTLLGVLMGLNEPSSGRYCLKGEDITHRASGIKSSCAIVPQDYAFYPELTGIENLQYFAGLYGLRGERKKSRLENVIEVAGLSEVLDTRARLYSGGVKRRLNLAIGLLNNPKILFLDEPTVGIDAQSRQFILDSINQLKASGMTIIYTSHYMEEVQAICDDIAIIDRGKVVVQSSLQDLVAEANKKVYIVTVDKPLSSLPPGAFNKFVGGVVDQRQLRVELDDLASSIPALFLSLNQHGLQIEDFGRERNSLEQIYLELTNKALRD